MRSEKTGIATDAVEAARSAFEGLPEHWEIAARVIERLQADESVMGLYLSGSFAQGKPDRWSDIDIYVVVADEALHEVASRHERLIRQAGDIVASFRATHLGDPHQRIVFYRASKPIHVDFQYRARGSLKPRKKDGSVIILLDRGGDLEPWKEACKREPDDSSRTPERIQYLEDRFWAWCWYAHAKIQRGELWEARDAVEYIRSNVLVPLAHPEGQLLEGNRRLEGKLSADTQVLLTTTIPAGHSASAYGEALERIMRAYSQLFDALPAEVRARIRQVDRDYFANAVREG